MRLLSCGDEAVLAELADLDAVLALHAALVDAWHGGALPGVVDLVPAARTVLVRFDPAATEEARVQGALRAAAAAPPASTGRPGVGETVEIPVTYDGEDLPEVARLTGLTEREVVRLHTGGQWRVAFIGFAPGFGYLVGGDPRLAVPRREQPRTRVPVGAVGLAGEFSGIYPRESPGGWQLVGRTDLALWDLDRDPPALLTPGVRVRFRALP